MASDYKLTASGAFIRVLDNASFVDDPCNKDYQAYLEWVAAGGVPDPYEPPPVLPVSEPPRTVAAIMGITIANGDIVSIGASYNIIAALYVGVGSIMLLYMNNVPPGAFVSGNSSATVSATESDVSYCVIETRDANNELIDVPRLDVTIIAF